MQKLLFLIRFLNNQVKSQNKNGLLIVLKISQILHTLLVVEEIFEQVIVAFNRLSNNLSFRIQTYLVKVALKMYSIKRDIDNKISIRDKHLETNMCKRRGRPSAIERYQNELLQKKYTDLINSSSSQNDEYTKTNIMPFIMNRQRRQRANNRERSRMQTLNSALNELKKHLPLELFMFEELKTGDIKNNKKAKLAELKLTKIDILKLAARYISMLSELLQQDVNKLYSNAQSTNNSFYSNASSSISPNQECLAESNFNLNFSNVAINKSSSLNKNTHLLYSADISNQFDVNYHQQSESFADYREKNRNLKVSTKSNHFLYNNDCRYAINNIEINYSTNNKYYFN
jgi:hypothetical protein